MAAGFQGSDAAVHRARSDRPAGRSGPRRDARQCPIARPPVRTEIALPPLMSVIPILSPPRWPGQCSGGVRRARARTVAGPAAGLRRDLRLPRLSSRGQTPMAPGPAAAATLPLSRADATLPLASGSVKGGDRYADPHSSGPKSPDGQPSPRFSPDKGPTPPDGRPSSDFGPHGGPSSADGWLSPRSGPDPTREHAAFATGV
jgi:hypothetical protein